MNPHLCIDSKPLISSILSHLKYACDVTFYLPLTNMRISLSYIFILVALVLKSQDKIYFLDGTTRTGKVTEIRSQQIVIKENYENTEIPRSAVLLIEFSDGSTEIINIPEENITANIDKKENFHFKQPKNEIYNYNQASINSLALCNADVTAFYERILSTKKIGLGLIGSYNFNLNANGINSFIAVLANAKKNYDLGAFINLYTGRAEKRTRFYYGMMIKYTSFNFTTVKEDSSKVGNAYSVTTNYKAAKGHQLATIFTIGTSTDITRNFFIKTIFGIGAFKLHGDYKEQYNRELNKQSNQASGSNTAPLNVKFLPKFYFGINLGFKL
ncbi:MAG: hypothetical protein ABIP51_14725 [Bacteroidia bacterium]